MNNLLKDLKRIQHQTEKLKEIKETKVTAKDNDLSVTITATNKSITFETHNLEFDKLLNAAYKELLAQIAKQQESNMKQMDITLKKMSAPLEKMKRDAEKAMSELSKNKKY